MQDMQNVARERLYDRIRLVRAGDQGAFAALLTDYAPLVGAEVSRHAEGLGAEDTEDLRQAALLALYRAALSFDLSQCGVEFGLYAKICISNALVSQLRVIKRYRTEVSVPSVFSDEQTEMDPATLLVEEENTAALYARVRSLLSPFENRVWTLYMAGFAVSSIATRLKKDTHSIENAVYRIRKKLRAALGNDSRD